MPVSSATMITSERTTSISTSDTRDQRLLGHDLGQVRMLIDDARADRPEIVAARHRHTEADAELDGDAPVGPSLYRRRRATFQIGRASCRERGEISGGPQSLKKNNR